MVVTLKVGLYLNPLIGYEKTNPKSKLLYHTLHLLKDIVEQSIRQRIGFIKVTIIVGMMVGYLNLKKMVDGFMEELSSHITKPMTHMKYKSKLTKHFG